MSNITAPRSAREIIEAHDRIDRAEAALDAIPTTPLPAEYVTATLGTDAWHGDPDETPVADSLADVTTREVPLEGGHVTVEHVYSADGGRVELTIWIGGALRSSLILSPDEADALGMAIARPHGLTVDDMWSISDALESARTTV